MNHTKKFNGKAYLYSNFRPSYPDELIMDLIDEHSLNQQSTIADIGSGTGIMTKKLLDFNLRVFAVEPNEEMRKVAEDQLEDNQLFTSIDGTAENTTLASNSVDFITVAQAFHWFDIPFFKKECQRVLKSSGKVIIVSNSRLTDTEIVQDIIAIYQKYCPEFRGFSNGLDNAQERFNAFFKNGYTYKAYDNPLFYNETNFIGRHLSASYAPRKKDKAYQFFIKELASLFKKYRNSGFLRLPNVTKTYCGNV